MGAWMKMGSKDTSGVIRSVAIPVFVTERNSLLFGHGHERTSASRESASSSICSCCCVAEASKEEERHNTASTTHCAV